MSIMLMESIFEQMGGTYHKEGDYLYFHLFTEYADKCFFAAYAGLYNVLKF